jgi:N-methylhydantoinase A
MPLFVGTDIGGTFTDLVGFDSERDRLFFGKTLTNYRDLVEGVVQCLRDVDLDPHAIAVLKHGTTQVINTLLERRGAKTALVTTEGFADILEIGRAGRPLPFDLDYARNPPLVPRHMRLELSERIDATGEVLIAPDEAELAALAERLGALDIEAVAIAFLNAYRNPAHEQIVARHLAVALPDLYVTTSAELSREWFEFERTSTAVANAYVGPRAAGYVERFEARLAGEGFGGRFFMMGSNGGILSVRRAKEQPIALVESGPIGGCIGAAAYSAALGVERLIAFDMGGTTAKCALIENQGFEVHGAYHVGGYDYGFPIQIPVVDIVEVGTGGGSVAYVDQHKRLHVGPRSAGSDPGPVCFGKGGTEPTVTDANKALDRIGGGTFLGGALRLDGPAAIDALVGKVGAKLGYAGRADADDIAAGVLTLANAQMATVIKEITIERGKDIRDFDLFAFGGGGPLHAVSLARELHIPRVIIPPEPGNFSALGMLLADARIDEPCTFLADLDNASVGALNDQLEALRNRVRDTLTRDFGAARLTYEQHVDMRYKGQRHAIRVSISGGDDAAAVRTKFLDVYRRRYGRADATSPVEFIGLHVTGFAQTDRPKLDGLHRAGAEPLGRSARRRVYFPEMRARIDTPIHRRVSLPIGFRLSGPVVIEEFGATTVIGPRERLEVGALGELRIELS